MKQTLTKLGGALFFLLFLVTSSAQTTITATWDWENNIPSTTIRTVNIQGTTGYVSSNVDGINFYVDATVTSGKLAYVTDKGYAQYNAGTIIRIPVASSIDKITIKTYSGQHNYTFGGSAATSDEQTFDVSPSQVKAGYAEIVSTGYMNIYSVIAVLAYLPPIKPIIAWDWENDESVRTFDGIQKGTSKEEVNIIKTVNSESYTLTADCTEAGKFWPNGSTPQFTTGAKIRIPVSSTMDAITIKIYKGEGKKVIINGNDYAVATSTNAGIGTYTAQASDVAKGYVEIVSACDYLYSIKLEKNDYFTTATIGSTGWATFSNTSATDFTNLDGVVGAYQVTGNTGSAIDKSAVTTVAANTGLLLNAAAGTYAIPLATTGTNLSATNKLVAVASSTDVGAAPTGYTNFVLVGGSGTASFKKITGGNSATVGAGKAYLQLAGDSFAPQLFFDDDVTAINKVETKKVEDGVFYNLAGQQVAQPTKGLYIVNGKKVVIK